MSRIMTMKEQQEDLWLKADVGSVHISTVRLPFRDCGGMMPYETGLFIFQNSNIVGTYATREEARAGHERYCAMTETDLKALI